MTTGKPLVYKPTSFQRHLWKYHKLTDAAAEASERGGRDQYEAFGDFADEVFHRMYADREDKLDTPAPGADPFVKLHERMDQIPELADFKARCQGNEHWAGIGTAAVIDTLVDQVQGPETQLEDARGDAEVQEMLQQLIDTAADPAAAEELQELLSEHAAGMPAKLDAAKQAADLLDDTQIRNAVRQAVKEANEQIDREEQLIDAFGFGMEEHSGRASRMRAHKEIADIIGQSERLKQIAELAGRMRRIAMEQQRQKPQKGTDEVTGIEPGADLGKLVPSEMLFAVDAIELVFAAKMLDRSLMTYELSKVPKKEQGPIVLLIDSSGSMANENHADIWAAAVSLAFIEIAHKQKRPVALVHFGSKVLRVDVFASWHNVDRSKMLESVSFFAADGGTNFMQPLDKAVEIIRDTGAFTEADIVIVTDGKSAVSDEFLQRWDAAKAELDFRCYSILVGSSTHVATNAKFSDEVEHLNDVLVNDEAMHKFFKRV